MQITRENRPLAQFTFNIEEKLSTLGCQIKKHHPWRNWAGTVQCQPQISCYPESVEELIQIVQIAYEARMKMRVVTQGHSWSALVPSNDILIFMERLNKVVLDTSDETNPLVVIEAGATVKEVNDVLEHHGYALPFNVVLESVRYGGLISTGSHGSGWNHSTLSDLVHRIELITAEGVSRRFEEGVDRAEVMNAVKLHLGMFGITTRIALKCQKSWKVHAVDQRLPLQEVINNLEEMVLAHENFDLFWWPFSSEIWVKTWDHIDSKPTAKPRNSWGDKLWAAISARLYNLLLSLCCRFPKWTPTLTRAAFRFTPSVRDEIVDIVEAIHYRRSIEVNRMHCVEIAFKIDSKFENVRQAINVVLEKTDAYAARGEYPFNVTMNVRFNHNSSCLLSPANGPGHTCYIEILSTADQEEWERFSAEVALEWLKLPGAKPHWAKEFEHIPGIESCIKAAYGDNIAQFNQIKRELGLDEAHLFMNDLLKGIFGN